MGRARKYGLLLEKGSHLREWVRLKVTGKMGQTWKINYTQEGVVVEKVGKTKKNGSYLEKWITLKTRVYRAWHFLIRAKDFISRVQKIVWDFLR